MASQQSSARDSQNFPEHLASGGPLKLDIQKPWPGLDAYDEASSDFFHGRGEEATELLRLIRLAALTVVYGKSGLGKTSLLQAGLFPLLRAEHYLPIHLRLDFSDGVKDPPIEQVMRRLKEELDGAKAEYPAPSVDESLWEYLHRKDLEIWSKDNFPLTPVLVFDQFEELFSRSRGNVELVPQVFDSLADLIENRIPAELASEAAGPKRSQLDLLSQRYRIVLSFREDFLPEVQTWEKKVPSLLRNYLRLDPMSRQRAIDAVERAGKAVLDESVAPWIVDFVGKRDQTVDAIDTSNMVIEPVLLSLCCYQLNRRRAPGSKIDKALVEHAGQDILDSFYREALDDPEVKAPPEAALFIEDYLVQGDHFRGDYPKEGALDKNLLTRNQLAALTNRHRLLRIVQRTDTARIELIHDRLVPVVRKARDERRIKAQQAEQERQAREAQAEAERQRKEAKREHERAEAARRTARRLRVFSVAVAVLLLLACVAGWLAYEKQQEATNHAKEARTASDLAQRKEKEANAASRLAKRNEDEAFKEKDNAQRALEREIEEKIRADRMQQTMRVVQATLGDAEGRLALNRGSERVEQTMYRGLAASRLADRGMLQTRAASLIALHSVMEQSAHLRKIVRIGGLEPTPALAYSPDGKTLAVGGISGLVWLLDAEQNFLKKGVLDCGQSSEAVWTLAFNNDGTRLAAGYVSAAGDSKGSGLVCVFDVVNRRALRGWSAKERKKGSGDVYSVAYSAARGKELIVSGGSAKLSIWDVESGRELRTPYSREHEAIAVAINADGRKVAWGGEDKIVRVWDMGDPNAMPMKLEGHTATIQFVMFSPADSSVLISAGDDGRINVWDLRGGCLAQRSKQQPRLRLINGVAIRRDGELVAAAGGDAKVRLYWLNKTVSCSSQRTSGASPKERQPVDFDIMEEGILSGHGGHVWAVAFRHDDQRLTSSGQDGSIRIWGPNTDGFSLAELRAKSNDGRASALPASVTALAISGDGKSIAAGDEKGNIHLWARPNEATEPGFQPAAAQWETAHAKAVRSIAYIRIRNRLTLVSGGDDGLLKRWDAVSGNVIGPDMADSAEPVRSIAVSPNGELLAAGSKDGTVRLWNAASGERVRKLEAPKDALDGYELYAVGFSRDGKYLAVGAKDGTLRVVSLENFNEEHKLEGHNEAVKWISRAGARWLLSAGQDGNLLEWQQATLARPQTKSIRKQDGFEFRMISLDGTPLTSVDTSQGGRLILTGGTNGQVQLWDGIERLLIGARFRGHGKKQEITAVALAPDGSYFVTAEPKKILVWPGPDRWADIICRKLVMNMTRQQWREWVSKDIEYVKQCPELPIPDDPAGQSREKRR